ncbi:hypothetical protein HBA54_26375 [Pelagibius litoralis]|uniref:Uncharacterized protein n=1 Tax=Pelagibius litoralis TaxID=374515 RepID=A0A967KIB5_9PROT|nr:hypothetical protein [Pelagibius litoralis]NIA72121.1 hypothetical protein [Pelagibius litoralis]
MSFLDIKILEGELRKNHAYTLGSRQQIQRVGMFSKHITGKLAGFTIAAATAIAISSPAAADDWLNSVERHYSAAESTKYQPEAGSEWGFSLATVMSDMEWRKKTAAALRNQNRPTVTAQSKRYRQLVQRSEPRRLSAF